jgi:hypothetical protein
MRSRALFFRSAALLLLVTAAAKAYSALTGTAKILAMQDAFLHINNWLLMCSVAMLEAGLALYLWRGRSDGLRAAALLWLSSDFMLYRFVNYLLDVKYCPCLGTLAQKLPLKPDQVDLLLTALVLYWFIGSLHIVRRSRPGSREDGAAAGTPAPGAVGA